MAKATFVRQTLVLLWKNATLKRRDCRGLLVDFGLTLFILFLLYWLGNNNIPYSGVENVPEARNLNLEQSIPTLQLLPLLLARSNRLLGITSSQANELIAFLDTRYVIPHTQNASIPNFHSTTRIFASVSDMEEYAKDSMQSNITSPLFAGIVFEKDSVTIRLSDELEESNGKAPNDGFEVKSDFGIFASLKNKSTTNLFPGFLPLQIAIQEYNAHVAQGVGCSSLATDLATFGLTWNDVKLSSIDSCISLQGSSPSSSSWLYSTLASVIPYPVAAHTEVADPITPQIIVCLVYIGLWPFSRFLRDTIIEKETKLKEYLYIIGVRESALVCSWVALYKIYALITTIAATLFFQDILFSSGAFFFGLFFFTFLVTVVCFGLIVVPFFNVSKTAMGISPFLYLAFCSPLLAQKLGLMQNIFWDILAAISSPTVFYNAFVATTGMGLDGKLKTIDFASIQGAWLHLVVLAIFYSLVGVYLDRILPKTIGVPSPWHYPFHMSYWRSNSCPGKYMNKSYQTFQTSDEESFVVKMCDVGKTYDDGKVAVQNLSLTIPSGEIFGLLGVNGAGKTTTLSMLSGMFAPTEGTLSVCGEEDMPSIRQHLGVCFQQDVLYENLTIEEHVLLLARLKGQCDDAAIKAECAAKCAAFGLSDKIHEFTKALSGGSKRKVCVILAFLGDAKLVLLDEPTTGIDLESQKSVWEAIRSESSDRAILLTTHSMQEAHVLSHRIGIMASGEMKCIGTSGQLRDTYGVGYKLRISKAKDDKDVSNLVRQSLKLVTGASVQREHKWGIDCQLPLGQEKSFPALLRSLDDLKLSNHISTYSISTTTLEDVFVRISTGDAVATAADEALIDSESPIAAKKAALDLVTPVRSSFFGIFGVQVKALIVKKALLLKRDIRSTASQFLWPIVFFCVISFLTVQIGHSSKDAIPTFSSPVGVAGTTNMSSGNFVPISLSGDSENGVVDYLLKHAGSTVGTVFANSTSHTIFYNASIPGALASTVNTLYCSVNHCDFKIHTKTLEMAAFSKNLSGVVSDFFGIVIAYFALMGLIVATTPYATAIVKERELGLKQYQHFCGAWISSYWFASVIFDIVSLVLLSVVIALWCQYLQFLALAPIPNVFEVSICLLVFPFAVVPYMYLIAFPFSSSTSAHTVVSYIGQFQVLFAFITILLTTVPNICSTYVSERPFIHALFPIISLGETLVELGTMELEFFRAMCSPNEQEATSSSLLHAYVVRTLLSGLVYFVLILILDTFWTYPAAFCKLIRCQGRSEDKYKKQGETTDAALEDGTSQAIYVDGLTKTYQSFWTKLTGRGNKVQALKSIDFSVPEGECVALLGVNGSGKSTTFQVLTACVTPTSGKATVASWDVSSEAIHARDHMGYCPQPNWLFEQLTVWEHLELVSSFRLRPVSSLESIVSALQLTPVASLRTAKLSGGNKRRVMIAMAVVGQPSVLLLDEPSAGVDVVARRLLWQLLRERTSTSCLFTTHCLEEAEAVCTSAVVLANGQRVYSGTISHLKQLVSKGLTIQVTFKNNQALETATTSVIEFLSQHVGETRALESFEALVSFEVNRPSSSTVTLADFFELIENSKEQLSIERYSISELALDQVFHHLTASS